MHLLDEQFLLCAAAGSVDCLHTTLAPRRDALGWPAATNCATAYHLAQDPAPTIAATHYLILHALPVSLPGSKTPRRN